MKLKLYMIFIMIENGLTHECSIVYNDTRLCVAADLIAHNYHTIKTK